MIFWRLFLGDSDDDDDVEDCEEFNPKNSITYYIMIHHQIRTDLISLIEKLDDVGGVHSRTVSLSCLYNTHSQQQ